MAQSIYDVLDSLKTETSVPAIGRSVEHSLPREMFPTGEQFESEEKLLEWARDAGCLHACLQKGVQKHLIDVRAAFKATKKDVQWTEAIGNSQVATFAWNVTERPKQGTSVKAVSTARYNDCLGMIGNLAMAKMPANEIRKIVVPIYGDDIVSQVFQVLEQQSSETE